MEEKSVGRTRKRGNSLIKIGVAIIIAVLVGVCIWQFSRISQLRNPDHSAEQAAKEARELKERVGKLMQLPDEDATVATVQDASQLSGQDFFKDAKDGDKVLIFTIARRAVIYRPSTNMIINSGPIVINSSSIEE